MFRQNLKFSSHWPLVLAVALLVALPGEAANVPLRTVATVRSDIAARLTWLTEASVRLDELGRTKATPDGRARLAEIAVRLGQQAQALRALEQELVDRLKVESRPPTVPPSVLPAPPPVPPPVPVPPAPVPPGPRPMGAAAPHAR